MAKYNPLADKAVSRIVEEGAVVIARESGALFVKSSSPGDFELTQDIIGSCKETFILCDTSLPTALIFKNTLQRRMANSFVVMPMIIVIDANEAFSVDSVLFLAHGAVDAIHFVINPKDLVEFQQRAYMVIASVNEYAAKLSKHFGTRTKIVVKSIFPAVNRDVKQAYKRICAMISDTRLVSVELAIEEVIKKDEPIEDCNEIVPGSV